MNAKQTLKTIAKESLEKCDPAVTPTICHMIVESGIDKISDMVIRYAIKNNVGIPSAISLLEAELG